MQLLSEPKAHRGAVVFECRGLVAVVVAFFSLAATRYFSCLPCYPLDPCCGTGDGHNQPCGALRIAHCESSVDQESPDRDRRIVLSLLALVQEGLVAKIFLHMCATFQPEQDLI